MPGGRLLRERLPERTSSFGPGPKWVMGPVRAGAGATPHLGGTLMIRWMERAEHRRARGNRPDRARKSLVRLLPETLEDRIAPATSLAPPTLLDPIAAIRVDRD